jgi:hypothetical protein
MAKIVGLFGNLQDIEGASTAANTGNIIMFIFLDPPGPELCLISIIYTINLQ